MFSIGDGGIPLDKQLPYGTFCRLYATEEACAKRMFCEKWPSGYRCPVCLHPDFSVIRTRRLPLYECRRCRHQASLTVGTVMERSRTPLVKWFRAIFLLSRGATAVQLAEVIEVTYKTAWLIAHKIRNAIQNALPEFPLVGHVRIVETRYGAASFGARYHTRAVSQPIIAAASVPDDGRLRQVRMMRITASHLLQGMVTKAGFHCFAKHYVAPDAVVVTAAGMYNFERYRPLCAFFQDATRRLNRTYFGLRPKHLQSYLDEYSYRHQLSCQPEPPFEEWVRHCSRRRAVPYRELIRAAA